ncbi:MAG: hypothetical protein NTY94_18490 [Alphaproteobacteria bacterium]|nr:hypothetical protein [Alphaproteobacteria bacterium]
MRGRSLRALTALALTLPLLPTPASAQSPPPGTRTECNSAGLAVGAIGETRLQTYSDGQGRTVELWCIRGMFDSHFDLRMVEHGQSVTIAGCYFAQARNIGPTLHLAPSGAYTRVEWINESLTAAGTSYRFTYDVTARQVTVTASAACRPPATITLPPQPDFRHLERLLPPAEDCPPAG